MSAAAELEDAVCSSFREHCGHDALLKGYGRVGPSLQFDFRCHGKFVVVGVKIRNGVSMDDMGKKAGLAAAHWALNHKD